MHTQTNPLIPLRRFPSFVGHLSHCPQTAKKETDTVKDEDMTYKLLWRNPNDASLDPVMAMIFHLGASGLLDNPNAPLYGNFDRNGKILIAHHVGKEAEGRALAQFWFTDAAVRVNLSCAQVSTSTRRVFELPGLEKCTDHAVRVFICSWGGHCQRDSSRLANGCHSTPWSGFGISKMPSASPRSTAWNPERRIRWRQCSLGLPWE